MKTLVCGKESVMTSTKIAESLESVGVEINGPNPWDIQVYDERVFCRIQQDNSLGLGESYMDGWWDCAQIDEMFCRLLRGGLKNKIGGNWQHLVSRFPGLVFNLHSRSRSHIAARPHYDLDNDLFFSFLDSRHQYSCGYFQGTDDLDEAQEKKLDFICQKLNLSPRDRILDLGCGWGGLARYAARHRGSNVTAVNDSQAQLSYAREICKDLPVRFIDHDYRSIGGAYDKIVSVGMFEHVGSKNQRVLMDVAHRSLKRNGLFLLQSIGCDESRSHSDPWMNKYIFPGGVLPSLRQISKAADGLFVIEDVQDLALHYDKTLMAWNDRFQKAWPQLEARYDARFKRMWEYYLLSCAGAFRARTVQLWQIVMTRA
jgi:cyclopropane-fatty-acyl-phospholipid synthase